MMNETTSRPDPRGKSARATVAEAGRRSLAGALLPSAVAVAVLMAVLALIFRLATGQSPWPVFTLVEVPCASVAFALLTVTAPR
jgi:fatty acid desaturase